MKNFITFCMGLILFSSVSNVFSAPGNPYEGTFIQPNGVTFQGREFGNEFLIRMETMNPDGYVFVKNPTDGYFYYAILDSATGDFKPSTYKVGIHTPLATSYGLERDSSIILAAFAQSDSANREGSITALEDTTLTLGVILVQFADTATNIDARGGVYYKLSPPPMETTFNFYTVGQYDTMFFTQNYYNSRTNPSVKSPDGDSVFGSFRDYWNAVSYGELDVTGAILNKKNAQNKIIWYTMPQNKAYYGVDGNRRRELISRAKQAAIDSGFTPNAYSRVAVVYAGEWGNIGGWAYPDIGSYIMHEKHYRAPFNVHIGWHCHEFGHTIYINDVEWLKDLYDKKFKIGAWDVMGLGIHNGRLFRGESPPFINPYYRDSLHWSLVTSFSSDNLQTKIKPIENYRDSSVYKFKPPGIPFNQYFYIENRQYRGFDYFLPGNSPSDDTCGLLIWQSLGSLAWQWCEGNSPPWVKLRPADDTIFIPAICCFGGDKGDPFDGFIPNANDTTHPRFEFSNFTTPKSTMDTACFLTVPTNFAVRSIRPASDFSTTKNMIADIHTFWDGHIKTNTTWSGVEVIGGDVTIDANKTLTISQGTTIKFRPNFDNIKGGVDTTKCEIIALGNLKAEGSASNYVNFVSSSTSPNVGDWYGIRVQSGGSAKLKYSKIEYVYAGVTFSNSAYDTLSNSAIQACQAHGVKTTNGNLVIKDNTIQGVGIPAGGSGIKVEGGKTKIFNDTLKSCYYGVHTQNLPSKPIIEDCDFIWNVFSQSGVRSDGFANDTLRRNVFSGGFLSAAMFFNGGGGGIAYIDSCTVTNPKKGLVGINNYALKMRRSKITGFQERGAHLTTKGGDLGISPSDPGNNEIYTNYSTYPTAKAVEETGFPGSDSVKAELNWWGTNPPLASYFIGKVDYSPYLTCPVSQGCPPGGSYVRFVPEPSVSVPEKFELLGNYPNPFNLNTQITYALPVEGHVKLVIYNTLGQRIRTLVNTYEQPGFKTIRWDGKNEDRKSV